MKDKTYLVGLAIICFLGIVMDSLVEGAIVGVLWFALCIYKRISSGEYQWSREGEE